MKSQILVGAIGAALLAFAPTAQAQVSEKYEKQWAAVADRIEQNIEKHRKGDAAIEVLDAAGKPVPGARLSVRQTGHEFLFGCNAFVLGQLDTPELNRKYEEAFVRLFNFATVPFYWAGTEPVEGELRYEEGSRKMWRRPPTDRFPPFAEKYGVTLKGHPLLWHAHNPGWIPKDPEKLKELYQKRFKEIGSRYGETIKIWDVVNESLECKPTFGLCTEDRAYVAWAFREAARHFPADNQLLINEVTTWSFRKAPESAYYKQVKGLLAQGLRIEGIGFQYHFFRRKVLDGYLASGNSDPARLLDVYEAFGDFERPLWVTEITIPSAGERGAELQARVTADLYRLWFSAPRMAGITWWNLGDNTAVKGENEALGGLVDARLDPKPVYRELDKLINHQWKTEAQLTTGAQGAARFRGFYGMYSVEVEKDGATQRFDVKLSAGEPNRFKLKWKP